MVINYPNEIKEVHLNGFRFIETVKNGKKRGLEIVARNGDLNEEVEK